MNRESSLSLKNNLLPLDTTSLSAKVYDRLLTAIVRQELGAGQPLDVDEMSELFKVSRTPVQAAISRLAELGLVEVRPRRGTFVAKLTTQDVHELFEIRGLIEVHCARKAIKLASDAQLSTLKGYVDRFHQFFSGDQYMDYYAFLESDREFHWAIVSLARNQRLARVYDQARMLIEVTRASARRDIGGAALTHERHIAIAETLIAKDEEKATAAIEDHIKESEQAILARLHFPEE